MRYSLTLLSENTKTGPIPVSITSTDSCPPSCGVYEECYAKLGFSNIHWSRVSKGTKGVGLKEFCDQIKSLPSNTLWRHNIAGDLPGKGEEIDRKALNSLIKANSVHRGFTYTHKKKPQNHKAIKDANAKGFTINLSADNPAEADELKALNIGPVVSIVESKQHENFKTPAGNLVVICPAVTHTGVTCATCALCAWKDREVIIGFPAHGSKKYSIDRKLVQIRG